MACEAFFSDAGALQLKIDQQALHSVFGRYTEKPGSYFRELGDAIKLLNLPQSQADFVRQVCKRGDSSSVDCGQQTGLRHRLCSC